MNVQWLLLAKINNAQPIHQVERAKARSLCQTLSVNMRQWSNSKVQAFADHISVERNRFSNTAADNLFAFSLGCIFKRYVIVWKLRDQSLPLIEAAAQHFQHTHALQASGKEFDWVEHTAQVEIQAEIEMNFECFFSMAQFSAMRFRTCCYIFLVKCAASKWGATGSFQKMRQGTLKCWGCSLI